MANTIRFIRSIIGGALMAVGLVTVSTALAYIYTSKEEISFRKETALKVVEAKVTSAAGEEYPSYSIMFEDENQRYPTAYIKPSGPLDQKYNRVCFEYYKKNEGGIITILEEKGIEKSIFGEFEVDRTIEHNDLYNLVCRKAWLRH